MYFETPVLEMHPRVDVLVGKRNKKWYCCSRGIDAWFKGLSEPNLRQLQVVLCFSTTAVRGAVKGRSYPRFDLRHLFERHGVIHRLPIWWWVEIVQ